MEIYEIQKYGSYNTIPIGPKVFEQNDIFLSINIYPILLPSKPPVNAAPPISNPARSLLPGLG